VLDELDGDLRKALGLGLIDEASFSEAATVAGLDQEAVDRVLQGEDLDEIALDRLTSQQDETGQRVESIIGIGPSRGSALRAAGFGTVSELAGASPETVADTANVSLETAQGFVDAAANRTQA
jgi:hypothetical protein